MIDGIWQDFLKIIHEEAGSRVVDTWFKAVILTRWDALQKEVHLEAPNGFVKDWIQNHYLPLCQTHLGRLLNVSMPKVIITDARLAKEKTTSSDSLQVVPARVSKETYSPAKVPRVKRGSYSHNNYSFDSFVVGPSNSLAYAAAHAVTEKPGLLYNPLFIYGGSGLGKTHLMHAIGNGIKQEQKKAVVLYQTTDRFVSEFISAIRFNKMHRFEQKYQGVDVLLIDDVQFISNKEQTQEAFFHIFNVLYDARKQIVFSSDTFPQNINGIAERLRSRLAWGLVTDIYTPSLETKVAIIKKKAELNKQDISDEVAYFIASRMVSNIRELEGALVRVVAFASLTQQEVTLELAQKVLSHSEPKKQHAVGFSDIIKNVNKYYPYDIKLLRSKSRNKDLAFARHVAMYLMKRLTNKSLRDIGLFLGGRDHSTIMHGLEKIKDHIQKHPDFNVQLKRIEEDILR